MERVVIKGPHNSQSNVEKEMEASRGTGLAQGHTINQLQNKARILIIIPPKRVLLLSANYTAGHSQPFLLVFSTFLCSSVTLSLATVIPSAQGKVPRLCSLESASRTLSLALGPLTHGQGWHMGAEHKLEQMLIYSQQGSKYGTP